MNLSATLRLFSIRTRMIGAIAMVLALLVIVGGVGLYGMSSLRDQTKLFAEQSIANAIQIGKSWAVFGTAVLWIGAAVGAAMIYAAIRLRRWRDDN